MVGLAPAGVEVALPAIEFLSEKSIIGSYYGCADPALTLPWLVELAAPAGCALADMVSHLIELDEVPAALDRLRRGEGDRSVIVDRPRRWPAPRREKRVPVIWTAASARAGAAPIPTARTSTSCWASAARPTAAALLTTFTSPLPGHTPILVVVGEDKERYEPVWPPTIMINKATALEPLHQKITWGAGQLGSPRGCSTRSPRA